MTINGEEFFTIREIAEISGKKYFAVKQLLHNADIKPVTTESLYEKQALDFILNAPPPGRPKKDKPK